MYSKIKKKFINESCTDRLETWYYPQRNCIHDVARTLKKTCRILQSTAKWNLKKLATQNRDESISRKVPCHLVFKELSWSLIILNDFRPRCSNNAAKRKHFPRFPEQRAKKKEQFSSRNIDCHHFLRQWLINFFHVGEEGYREVVVCSIYGWNCSFRDDSCTTARWLHAFVMNCNFLATGNIDYIVSYAFLTLSYGSWIF